MPSLNVLIVDDSILLRGRLGFCLAKIEGVEVVGKASDVPGGIEAFRRLQPDVVVLDIQMPGGSGFDVLEVIKRERPATKVVIFTNYPLPAFRKKSEMGGAEWFFDKTAEYGKILEVLRGLAHNGKVQKFKAQGE